MGLLLHFRYGVMGKMLGFQLFHLDAMLGSLGGYYFSMSGLKGRFVK